MDYSFKQCADNTAWDNLIKNSLQGSFFSSSYFLNLTNSLNRYFISYKNKIVAGVIINSKTDKKIIPYIYQGLILHKDFEVQKNHKFYKKYSELILYLCNVLKNEFKKCEISLHHSIHDLRAFQWFNYNQKKESVKILIKYTGILHLNNYKNFENYLNEVRAVRRQEYKKNNDLFDIVEEYNTKNLDKLHEKTFLRQNIKRNSLEKKIVKRIITKLLNDKIGRLVTIKLKNSDKAISSSYFLTDNKNAYNLTLATDPIYRKYSPGTKLLFNQIKNCFSKKINRIDFVGVNSPDRGDYKLSFNPELKKYFIINYN